MPPNSDLNNVEPQAGKPTQPVRTGRIRRLGTRLLGDKSAFTALQFVFAGLVFAIAGLAAFRTIAGVITSVVFRVHVLLTLPLH